MQAVGIRRPVFLRTIAGDIVEYPHLKFPLEFFHIGSVISHEQKHKIHIVHTSGYAVLCSNLRLVRRKR